MRRQRALWLVALTAALVLLLAIVFALLQDPANEPAPVSVVGEVNPSWNDVDRQRLVQADLRLLA